MIEKERQKKERKKEGANNGPRRRRATAREDKCETIEKIERRVETRLL